MNSGMHKGVTVWSIFPKETKVNGKKVPFGPMKGKGNPFENLRAMETPKPIEKQVAAVKKEEKKDGVVSHLYIG